MFEPIFFALVWESSKEITEEIIFPSLYLTETFPEI